MGKFDKSYAELQKELAAQDAQLAEIQNAETIFENIMAGNYFTFADKYLSAYPKNSNSK